MVCLTLASKFYCETEDTVVSVDVCRLIGLRGETTNSFIEGAQKLMRMELKMMELLDYNLFVPLAEYNRTKQIFNKKIKDARVVDE